MRTVGMKEEEIRNYFTEHSKMFYPHSFIKFVTGIGPIIPRGY